jgi:large subunit ribosomal protein L18
MANNKRELFLKRRLRVRNKIKATCMGVCACRCTVRQEHQRPADRRREGRDDCAASTLEKDLGVVGKNNVEAAAKVGAAIAERAKKAGVEECYFDRGGFLFHGKIKALKAAKLTARDDPGAAFRAPTRILKGADARHQ